MVQAEGAFGSVNRSSTTRVCTIMTTQSGPPATTSPDLSTKYPSPVAPSRRNVLIAAGMGAGALTVAACGGSSAPVATTTSAAAPAAVDAASSGNAAPAGNTLVALDKVPVGGAVAATDANGKPIIVAQPTAGKAVAFSATCTHQGCQVKVAGVELDCPCHGSKFNALTGAVLKGPAAKPLPEVTVAVANGNVVAG